MAKHKKAIIEYRNYNLPTFFPVLLLSGEEWRISDVPSGRLHFHNCMEIGICESDSGTMEFMSSTDHFSVGDITIVGSDISHTTYSSPGTASKWSYLFIDFEELLAPYFPMSLFTNQDSLHHFIHNYYAILPRGNHPDLYQLLMQIIHELKQKDNNYQFLVRGLILSLLIKLLNLSESAVNKKVSSIEEASNSLVIAPALDYIRINYAQEFPMDDLAALCDMSPTHFRRTFTNIMGEGPLSYLTHVRISKASVLLRTTEMPVLDISEEVGFRSVSSFNRHFAEIMGIPPLKWRKQMSYIHDQSVLKYTGWLVPPKA